MLRIIYLTSGYVFIVLHHCKETPMTFKYKTNDYKMLKSSLPIFKINSRVRSFVKLRTKLYRFCVNHNLKIDFINKIDFWCT